MPNHWRCEKAPDSQIRHCFPLYRLTVTADLHSLSTCLKWSMCAPLSGAHPASLDCKLGNSRYKEMHKRGHNLGRIACMQWTRCGLLLQSHVAWSVCLSPCLCRSYGYAVQKRQNRSRWGLEGRLLWVQWTM